MDHLYISANFVKRVEIVSDNVHKLNFQYLPIERLKDILYLLLTFTISFLSKSPISNKYEELLKFLITRSFAIPKYSNNIKRGFPGFPPSPYSCF